jgi:hypothetical protein
VSWPNEHAVQSLAGKYSDKLQPDLGIDVMEAIIRDAMIAERRRCAEIAAGIGWQAKEGANPKNAEMITKIVADTGLRIARAIRGEA